MLDDWLSSEYDVLVAGSVEDAFDIAIVDEASFSRRFADLQSRKAAEEPRFLPYLLMSPAPAPDHKPEMREI